MPRRVGLGALLAVLALAGSAAAQQAGSFTPGGAHPSQIHFVPIDISKATKAYYAARVVGQQNKNPLAVLSAIPKVVNLVTAPFKSNQGKVVNVPIPPSQRSN